MNAGKGFGSVEGSGARANAVRCKRLLRGLRNRLLHQRMRQRLERRIVLEREVRTLISLDENEDTGRIVR